MGEAVFRKRDRPEYCPGCYSLHLYCDHENPAHRSGEFPHEYGQECETGAQARREAREAGWVLHRDNTATCPKCSHRALSPHGEGE